MAWRGRPHAQRMSLCLINVHYVQCPVSHRHWSWISSRILPSPFTLQRQTSRRSWDQFGGDSVSQTPPCRRQTSLCRVSSLIGLSKRPIRSRRGLQKAPPRTRAVCTQESEAVESCCHTLDNDMFSGSMCALILRMLRPVTEMKRYYFFLTGLSNINMSWCGVLWWSGAERFLCQTSGEVHTCSRTEPGHTFLQPPSLQCSREVFHIILSSFQVIVIVYKECLSCDIVSV